MRMEMFGKWIEDGELREHRVQGEYADAQVLINEFDATCPKPAHIDWSDRDVVELPDDRYSDQSYVLDVRRF
jgi:hypothetical protein